ncbi:MAG: D-2-hydroxyacid dehydrogenase [Vicinamibacterales bacterium]
MTVLVAAYSDVAAWCIPEPYVERLRREFPRHTFVRADSDAETMTCIGGAEVALGARIRPDHLAAARRLRWIHSPAAGVGNMLFPGMVASAVIITNSRGNSSVTIAEHVIAVTLALLRRLPLAFRRQQERVWAQDEFAAGPPVATLRGARMLIVGLGSIGGGVAVLAAAFGATVIGVRRTAAGPRHASVAFVVTPDRLHAELPLADVVLLAAPQTAATTHLMGARELALMKKDAVLVNVGRGSLVDEAALAGALEAGALRGAALDVFNREPLPRESPLWSRPDVLITPHVSGFHPHHWDGVVGIFADNLRRFDAGAPLMNVVDKEAGY